MPSSMKKHGTNLSKPSLGCCFHRNFVNLNRLMIAFWNTFVIYDSWKGRRSAVSNSEHIKSDSQFEIPNGLINFPAGIIDVYQIKN